MYNKSILEKWLNVLEGAKAPYMESSKMVNVEDARKMISEGKLEYAVRHIEKGAQYVWGFNRPDGWMT